MKEYCANQRQSHHLLAFAVGMVLLLATCLDAFSATVVGSLTQVTGTPHVTRAGSTMPATDGMSIDLADKLTTGSNSSLVLTFDDGSTIELSENSVLVINEHVLGAGKTTASLLEGRLIAVVTKGLRMSAPHFVIQTPNAFLAVRGTKFKVKYAQVSSLYNGPSTEVAVLQGTVIAANRSAPNQTVEVQAGYETVILGREPPMTPGPIGLAGMGSGRAKGFAGSGPGAAAPPPPPPPPAPPPIN